MSLQEIDGVFVNTSQVSLIKPGCHSAPDREFYRIQFVMLNETYEGNTEFSTEAECNRVINRALNPELYEADKCLTCEKTLVIAELRTEIANLTENYWEDTHV